MRDLSIAGMYTQYKNGSDSQPVGQVFGSSADFDTAASKASSQLGVVMVSMALPLHVAIEASLDITMMEQNVDHQPEQSRNDAK